MFLRATKPLEYPRYSGRHLVPGDEFCTKTRAEALILVGTRKAEYVDRVPGRLPAPPVEVLDRLADQVVAGEVTLNDARQAAGLPQIGNDRHPLDHDGDGRPGGSPKPEDTGDLATLRAEYAEAVGKRPFHGWDEATLRQKIAEARA